jgi:hypothetical protein
MTPSVYLTLQDDRFMPFPSSAITAKLEPQLLPIQTTNDGQHYLSLVASTTRQLLSSYHSPFMSSLKQQAGQLIHKISQMFTLRRLSTSTVRTHRKRSSTNSFLRLFRTASIEEDDQNAAPSSMPSPPGQNNTLNGSNNQPVAMWICHECNNENVVSLSAEACIGCPKGHMKCILCEEVVAAL